MTPRKLPCEVSELIDHGDGVYSVLLKPAEPAPRFLPGQFLHLALDPYNPGDFWPDSRPFSIASPPADRSLLRITYAVQGRFTARMEAELRAGQSVWVKLPYGEFTVNPESDVCLLAGGTGITAFTAFLSDLPSASAHGVHVFYGARCPELLIYRPLIEAALGRSASLHAIFMAEQSADGTDCLPGRLNVDLVWRSILDPFAVTYYMAGPPAMLNAFTQELRMRGIAQDRILIDAWE